MFGADVRRLLLKELDPSAGACMLVIARLVDVPAEVPASQEDILAVVTAARASGDVPIGPIEYADEPIEYTVHATVPMATVASAGASGPTLKLALALGAGGSVGVAGGRYGHLPHISTPVAPTAMLLPDLEAGLAEFIVYTGARARQLGYSGCIRASLEIHSPGPVLPFTVDPKTGRAVHGAPIEDFAPISFEYSLQMPNEHIRRIIYGTAWELASRFGAPAPQFLSRPER